MCTRPQSSSQRRFWTRKASESLSLFLEMFAQVERTFLTFSQNASEIHCHMRCATSPAGSSIRIRKKATGRPGNRGGSGSGETFSEDNLRPVTTIFHFLITCRVAKVMRKRSDIVISVWRTHLDGHGSDPLTDSPSVPRGGSWGLSSCHLQTRHNYEISYPYEWGERLDGSPHVVSRFFWVLSQYNGTANPICP